jgi:hypothetical protein
LIAIDKMGDIEESIFKSNVPGKYSTWKLEHDDRRTDNTADIENIEDEDGDIVHATPNLPNNDTR